MNSHQFFPLRDLPNKSPFRAGDVLAIFGEVFSRGYVNGLIEEAERNGVKVIYSTVGRRNPDGSLRALNESELQEKINTGQKPLINIPLEAGFDFEPCEHDSTTPVDQLKNVKINEWNDVQLDWKKIENSRSRARERFRDQTAAYLIELEKHIPPGARLMIAHTMAGGVPRAKILMPTMNRVFKGVGERYVPSETFWKSQLGRLAEASFEDVTAETFKALIELSKPLRDRIKERQGQVCYVGYGYHGTEVLMNDRYEWQTYAPYLQGWAKLELERIAVNASAEKVSVSIFNCPEILTNSSSIFVGVEVPLYAFLGALKKEGLAQTSVLKNCQALLNDDHDLESVVSFVNERLASKELRSVCDFKTWPSHSNASQLSTLLEASEQLISMHKSSKALLTAPLSEEIFRATGYLMFHEAPTPRAPVLWLGHDILAKTLKEMNRAS